MVIRLLFMDKTRSDISLIENLNGIYQICIKTIDTQVEFKVWSGIRPTNSKRNGFV